MNNSRIPAVAAALIFLSVPGAAEAQPPNHSCFFANEFENWKAPDAKTIYIRAGVNRYYRLDLAGTCAPLLYPDSHLVTRFHGSDSICSAVDWDLKVSQGPLGMSEPCIVKAMTPLAPDEAAAIPPKFKP
jgi:hypothetical protein